MPEALPDNRGTRGRRLPLEPSPKSVSEVLNTLRKASGSVVYDDFMRHAHHCRPTAAVNRHNQGPHLFTEERVMRLAKPLTAEFIGTFWLVFAGCGSAVLAAAFPSVGIGLLGVSLAFGLTVLTMAYTIGHISGCHLNPAVSIGLAVARRFSWSEVAPYIVAQVAGAVVAAMVLYLIASGKPGFSLAGGLASNGFGDHSPGGYSLLAGFVTEVAMTMMFLFIILGSTDDRAPRGFAPIAIGLGLTLIHLVGIPVTNLSVNPARSTGPAIMVGGWAIAQLWLFWAAPIAGAVLGALMYGAVTPVLEAERVEPGLRPAPVGPVSQG